MTTFAMQNCRLNSLSILYKPFWFRSLTEYTVIDMKVT